MNFNSKLSRRKFLAASATAVAAPTIIPSSALGLGKRAAPSNRINLAVMGFGAIAHHPRYSTVPIFLKHDKVQLVAIADPNRKSDHYGYQAELQGGRLFGMQMVNEYYANATGQSQYRGCRAYEDFRELLDTEDVDAVNICTPDHWHAVMTIYCANLKKHVYSQKPLAQTIEQGRAMVDAVARNGITFQTGSQQRSDARFREAVEFVRNGRLGKLKKIKVVIGGGHNNFNGMADRKEPEPVPDGLNWDLWLGPAPYREYRPALFPGNWRNNFDYGGGVLTDWGAHHVDIAQWALDMDKSGPVLIDNIEADLPPSTDLYNIAKTFRYDCTYANGVKMSVMDNKTAAFEHNNGIVFEGDKGKTIFVMRGSISMNPPELRRERIQDHEERVYESDDHIGNFVDCIYSGKPTIAPVEAAHRTISICHLANIAIRLGRRTLKWDPERERVIGDNEANSMLSRPLRGNWSLR